MPYSELGPRDGDVNQVLCLVLWVTCGLVGAVSAETKHKALFDMCCRNNYHLLFVEEPYAKSFK